jgi:hypothetical protein
MFTDLSTCSGYERQTAFAPNTLYLKYSRRRPSLFRPGPSWATTRAHDRPAHDDALSLSARELRGIALE